MNIRGIDSNNKSSIYINGLDVYVLVVSGDPEE